MLQLNTSIEGKRANFGHARERFHSLGCSFCSNFDYHQGKFDAVLWREAGETIYLRIPINVVKGELDHSNAVIEFGTPFVIKHVVNIGLDYDENSLLTATTGMAQFQNPIDEDANIRDKSRWVKAGEEAVEQIYHSLTGLLSS